jgi:hypothetical protein
MTEPRISVSLLAKMDTSSSHRGENFAPLSTPAYNDQDGDSCIRQIMEPASSDLTTLIRCYGNGDHFYSLTTNPAARIGCICLCGPHAYYSLFRRSHLFFGSGLSIILSDCVQNAATISAPPPIAAPNAEQPRQRKQKQSLPDLAQGKTASPTGRLRGKGKGVGGRGREEKNCCRRP